MSEKQSIDGFSQWFDLLTELASKRQVTLQRIESAQVDMVAAEQRVSNLKEDLIKTDLEISNVISQDYFNQMQDYFVRMTQGEE